MQYLKKNKDVHWRFIRFTAVGSLTTVVGLALYYLFIVVLSINIYVSYIAVFMISVAFSAIVNSIFNYKRLFRFGILLVFYRSYILGFLTGLVLIFLLKRLFPGLDDFIIAVLMVPLRTIVTFFFVDRAVIRMDDGNSKTAM